jgi:hypothetical protein
MVSVNNLINDVTVKISPGQSQGQPYIHNGDIVHGDKVGQDKVGGDKTE